MKSKKKFVSLAIKNDEAGMTFVSMLMAMTIFGISLPFIIFFLSQLDSPQLDEDLQVQQFFIFIRDDALMSEHVYAEDNKLFFSLDTGETAKVEQYQNLIRRQVNGRGHEIYLRNIETFIVKPVAFGNKLIITTDKGATYEKTIATYE